MNKKEIANFFQDEEDILNARKIFDNYLKARDKHYSTHSDFYNPIFISRICSFFELNTDEIKVSINGGYNGAERCIVTFTPNYVEDVLPFSYIQIEINKFQKELKHRDILGSIIGLGITREKVGDIILKENYAYVVVLTKISNFIIDNLKYIGRQKVVVSNVSSIDAIIKKELIEKTVTISSLRIDNFVAKVTNLSRSEVKKLIEQEKVFVNFNVLLNFSKVLSSGDVVTIRGFGRFYFNCVTGQSKKGKYIIKYSQ